MGIFSSLIDWIAQNDRQETAQGFQAHENMLARNYQTSEREAMQEYQTSERVAQNEWNLAQWNRENEYNSPMEQIRRLREAGLNPNMMYGNGGEIAQASALQGSSGGAPSSGSPGAFSAPNAYVSPGFSGAITDAIQNLIGLEEFKSKKITNQTLAEYNRASIAAMKASAYKDYESGNLSHMQYKQISLCLDSFVRRSSAEADIAEQTYQNLITQQDLFRSQIKKTEAETVTEQYKQQNLASETSVNWQQAQKLKWENFFRSQFNVDPHDPPVAMLIQGLLQNDKQAQNTMNQIFLHLRGVVDPSDDGKSKSLPQTIREARRAGVSLKDILWAFPFD